MNDYIAGQQQWMTRNRICSFMVNRTLNHALPVEAGCVRIRAQYRFTPELVIVHLQRRW